MKTFSYMNHQGKGNAFRKALLDAGWRHVDDHADIVLADSDVTPARRENLQRMAEQGSKIFLYPHAARPPVHYDFDGYPPSGVITAQFVTAPVHEEILRIIGYEGDVFPVGWSLCPLKPYHPISNVRRIVFAPVHVNGNGWMSHIDQELNRAAFEKIYKIARDRKAELMVRYLNRLEACGLKKMPGADYIQGQPDQSFHHIDRADLVVSTQTFQYLSVARGKPTIGMGEDISPKIGNSEESFGWARSWSNYKELMKFPLDILGDTPLNELIEAATGGCASVNLWRHRLIGSPFDPHKFLVLIESYL